MYVYNAITMNYVVYFIILIILMIYLNAQTIADNPLAGIHRLTIHTINKNIYNTAITLDATRLNTVRRHPSTSNTKVVFFTCHDYDALPQYASKAQQLTQQYCKHHGYTFIDSVYKKGAISPYWTRVDRLLRLSEMYDEDTIFVYTDLDACVNPIMLPYSVPELLSALNENRVHDVYIGKDYNYFKHINSGVIILRNTEWSRKMLHHWWQLYDPSKWIFDGSNWNCTANNRVCVWAGDNYEQGVLENMYISDWNNCKQHIGILDVDFMSNASIVNQNTFIYHLMGQSATERYNFFAKLEDVLHRVIEESSTTLDTQV